MVIRKMTEGKSKDTLETLKTRKGSSIKRYRWPNGIYVGKEVAYKVYFHKDYAEKVLPFGVYEKAKEILNEEMKKDGSPIKDFKYNALCWCAKTNVLRFDEAPDFDLSREPHPGMMVSIDLGTGKVKIQKSDQIWHHKWLWVMDDYSGFDVRQSYEWSRKWLSAGIDSEGGIGKREKWNSVLSDSGLPLESRRCECCGKAINEGFIDDAKSYIKRGKNTIKKGIAAAAIGSAIAAGANSCQPSEIENDQTIEANVEADGGTDEQVDISLSMRPSSRNSDAYSLMTKNGGPKSVEIDGFKFRRLGSNGVYAFKDNDDFVNVVIIMKKDGSMRGYVPTDRSALVEFVTRDDINLKSALKRPVLLVDGVANREIVSFFTDPSNAEEIVTSNIKSFSKKSRRDRDIQKKNPVEGSDLDVSSNIEKKTRGKVVDEYERARRQIEDRVVDIRSLTGSDWLREETPALIEVSYDSLQVYSRHNDISIESAVLIAISKKPDKKRAISAAKKRGPERGPEGYRAEGEFLYGGNVRIKNVHKKGNLTVATLRM